MRAIDHEPPPLMPPVTRSSDSPRSSNTSRLWEIDAVRGLMLVLMTITHLSTFASNPSGQPFGFVSAAEGFVLMSAFMAGLVYSQRAMKDGVPAMRRAFISRALKIYGSQAALLIFLFTFIATLGLTVDQYAVTDLMDFYIKRPLVGLIGSLLLMYNPPLLDILPIYILFMLVSPPILAHGLRHGWNGILAGSITIWVLAQFELGQYGYEQLQRMLGLPIPYELSGAFRVLGWQFLWVLGLWMGATCAIARAHHEPAFPPFPRWMVVLGTTLALTFLVWRHVIGQVPFPQYHVLMWQNAIFDKWHLAPLRVINLFALLIVAMRFGPTWLRALPRLRWLELLGSASLPVFCAQLVIVLLVLATFGEWHPNQRSNWVDVGILVVSFLLLTGVAWISALIDRHSATVKRHLAERRARRAEARGTAT